MKRFSLRVIALVLCAAALLLSLASCKKEKGDTSEVALPPEGATFVFSEVKNVRVEGEGASDEVLQQLSDVFPRDYYVYVYEGDEAIRKLDRVTCKDGVITLYHYIGKGTGELTSVGSVYAETEEQTLTLGSYGEGAIKLTRPHFEYATYADGTLTFSLMESTGNFAYHYDVLFTQITR